MTTHAHLDHLFRHEYGRLVAVLSRQTGVQRFDDVEDAVQSAMISALEHWTINGVPDDPSAWLYRVAQNGLRGEYRKHARRRRLLEERGAGGTKSEDTPAALLPGNVQDDQLRMLFVCCDDVIPSESQIVLALKVLCGFDVREIADRLFATEASIYKRLGRAKAQLRAERLCAFDMAPEELAGRLPGVHTVLYLLFTEGYLSSKAEGALRLEVCEEAVRLVTLLADQPVGRSPETYALLALMHLHLARHRARADDAGALLLLEEQDRTLWDPWRIHEGLKCLAMSADGDRFSRYHAEAGIAAEHCRAASFSETRWDRIAECYLLLEQSTNSPLHRLNRAVATAEWKGPAAGLEVLQSFSPPTWLAGSHLWAAALADLHRRCGNAAEAARYREAAIASAPTQQVKQLLSRRLARP